MAVTHSSAHRSLSARPRIRQPLSPGNDNVSVTYFGDGAANQGQVYESFNMAALWKLPIIYIVENNPLRHGHLDRPRNRTVELFAARPVLRHPRYPGGCMDVRAVKAAAVQALEHCRSGKGPIFLNADYRYRGHSMSDPAKYRSKDEVQKMRSEHDRSREVKARLWSRAGQRRRIEGHR